jgi:hypothetical protein
MRPLSKVVVTGSNGFINAAIFAAIGRRRARSGSRLLGVHCGTLAHPSVISTTRTLEDGPLKRQFRA